MTSGEALPAPSEPMAVGRLLGLAHQSGVARLDAQVLLGELLQRPRAWLLAHDDHLVEPAVVEVFRLQCRRRTGGEPVAYLVGWKEFRGRRFEVGPGILVPRPETEGLVDWALELVVPPSRPVQVADLGTGSGAIAISLALARPAWRLHATDISPAALAVAERNARRLGADIGWFNGSWWAALPQGATWDLVVSNPPYVAGRDPHLSALAAEPSLALTPGPTGLEALSALAEGAHDRLSPGGWMLVEHGHDQGAAVRALFAGGGLRSVSTRCDLAGLERWTAGQRPPADPTI